MRGQGWREWLKCGVFRKSVRCAQLSKSLDVFQIYSYLLAESQLLSVRYLTLVIGNAVLGNLAHAEIQESILPFSDLLLNVLFVSSVSRNGIIQQGCTVFPKVCLQLYSPNTKFIVQPLGITHCCFEDSFDTCSPIYPIPFKLLCDYPNHQSHLQR